MKGYKEFEYRCFCGHIMQISTDAKEGTNIYIQCDRCKRMYFPSIPKEKTYNPRLATLLIHDAIMDIFKELQPKLTIRQIYYALTVRDVVPKTQKGYRQTIYHLGVMRDVGIIPYGWIADNTRWHIKPNSHNCLGDALNKLCKSYRRDIWASQKSYVEIWVEKDALASVISPITDEYDVPLYVARGYGSTTFIYEAAEAIMEINKPVHIYHFGDFDPSGVDAAYKIRDGLIKHGADVNFQRAAITEWQILEYDLPARETKKSDPRYKKWGNKDSVELDALPAPALRSIVRKRIEAHLDKSKLKQTREDEERDHASLTELSKNFVLGQNSSEEEGAS